MKKIFNVFICLLIFCCFPISANAQTFHTNVYDLSGKRVNEVIVDVTELIFKEDNGNTLVTEADKTFATIGKEILSLATENENLLILDFKVDDENTPYPEIESMNVNVRCPILSGGRNFLGKDYRIIYYVEENSQDINENIIDSNLNEIRFSVNKLGKYIIFLNPSVYNVTFYSENPIYDDGNLINTDCIYSEMDDMQKKDEVIFPTLPEKEGYIFTGWKAQAVSGKQYFTESQPLNVVSHSAYYASWVPEDEYEPINIEISSSEPITKGKENGKKITLKTNYGVFVKDDEFPTEWRTAYEAETEEDAKADILSDWKSKWNIVGSDDIMIETAMRVDDKTLEFTLSGNSSDKYSNADIYIEFDNALLMPEPYEADGEIVDWDDTKIKMDSDGVRAKMYRSDNTVTLSKQSRPSSGGGITRYTVTFDANGGSAVSKQTVNRNTTIKEPEIPQKEDYIFAGWFTDKELTTKFDFTTKVTKNITLYAKWDIADKTKDQIIFTIGKTEASVFGEPKQNDVAPIIKGDRAFLPARFVAENLGAKVEWDSAAPGIVTIAKDDVKIVIYIGEEYASVNGEKVKLDSPAFIDNDRTYTPIRFISEEFGATVEWLEETHQVVITKK